VRYECEAGNRVPGEAVVVVDKGGRPRSGG